MHATQNLTTAPTTSPFDVILKSVPAATRSKARAHIEGAIATSSMNTYAGNFRRATIIAGKAGVPTSLPWDPATAITVMAAQGRKSKAGITALAAAIADAHVSLGYTNVMAHPVVKRTTRGAKRAATTSERRGYPISMRVIQKLKFSRRRPVWAAIASAGTAGLMRIGDLLPASARKAPRIRDIRLSSGDGLHKLSFRKARSFSSFRAALRSLGDDAFIELIRPEGTKTSQQRVAIPFSHKVANKWWNRFAKERFKLDMNKDAPLFSLNGSTPVSRRGFLKHISKHLKKARIHIDDTTHRGISMRAGGATALFEAGWPDVMIKAAGRRLSEAYTVYTRIQPGQIAKAARSMRV